MKKDCRYSIGYNEHEKVFYWNINDKVGITNTKDLLIECCTCDKYREWCNKSDALYRLLKENAPQTR